jgi:glutamine synthetase
VELRSPDPSCNPYLALAVCLAAGLDGIERFMTPPGEVTGNLYTMGEEERRANGIEALPTDLGQALELMQQDKLVMDTLGEHVANAFLTSKRAEWAAYQAHVSDWERESYIIAY